eukprot:CAMPEP_0182580252 /NCGR_PEP_ID=MMETSP1324-20130603/46423_1 /TAXON_ID=236786 /ORGANISM="Florenciella sp., Strain RCC1587" /LENGTH=127 /DNA_ID=CAMNT_0024796447 /DNA_START=54 /DNA_END=434 /DNA_ORIENTATION=+
MAQLPTRGNVLPPYGACTEGKGAEGPGLGGPAWNSAAAARLVTNGRGHERFVTRTPRRLLLAAVPVVVWVVVRARDHVRDREGIDELLEVRIARNVRVSGCHVLERPEGVVHREVRVGVAPEERARK